MLHIIALYSDPTLKEFRLVKNVNNHDGYFKQIKYTVLSLAGKTKASNNETIASICFTSAAVNQALLP